MKLRLWQKNILSGIVILAAGFILFHLAFLLAALVIQVTARVLSLPQNAAPHLAGRVLYFLLIFFISWLVFRSRLNDTMKAAFFTMPLMIILVMLGIVLHQQARWVILGVGALILIAVLSYLYRNRLSWQYYFSTFYVAALALFILLSGIDI